MTYQYHQYETDHAKPLPNKWIALLWDMPTE